MRIWWADNLRWLWIILIVVWHSFFPDKSLLVKYLFSFHVVLFFFLSWFLFNDEKHKNFISFIKNKFSRLIIPFIFFNTIMFVFNKLKMYTWGEKFLIDIDSFLKWILYWDYLPNHKEIILTNVPTWFLTSLFIVSIYYFIINKYIKNRYYRILILFILSIWIYIESRQVIFRLPWNMEISLMATFFYWLWHSFKKEISNFVEKINYYYLLLIPLLVLFNLNFISLTNFANNYYWKNYIIFLLNWFSWILTFIILSKLIKQNFILTFLWKNSIIILGMEWIKFIVLSFIIKLSLGTLIFEQSYLNAFIQIITTFIALIPIIYIINKYFWFMIWNYKKVELK